MQFPIGTRCFIEKVSVDSMRAHAKYQKKGFPLKCPCVYKPCDTVIVKTKLSEDLAMVYPENHPNILSIICWKDLTREQ